MVDGTERRLLGGHVRPRTDQRAADGARPVAAGRCRVGDRSGHQLGDTEVEHLDHHDIFVLTASAGERAENATGVAERQETLKRAFTPSPGLPGEAALIIAA
jgi:hypothetical protein